MLNFSRLALRRSTTLLFDAVDIKIYPGQKLGITGANGCGKSSLFALILGRLSVDQGEFTLPRDWAVAEVEQETSLTDRIAVEYVIDGDEELRQVETRLADAERKAAKTIRYPYLTPDAVDLARRIQPSWQPERGCCAWCFDSITKTVADAAQTVEPARGSSGSTTGAC